jgi:metal-dependent amidase/aminoacylase/carboxypeptidase family protein
MTSRIRLAKRVDRLADELERLSHRIHANPELCFKEEKAAAWLAEFLELQGAQVERGVGGLPTAFRPPFPAAVRAPRSRSWRSTMRSPTSAMRAATNVIATAGSAAPALRSRAALKTLPFSGRIQVIGTRPEEGGAGKVKLMEAGDVFERQWTPP